MAPLNLQGLNVVHPTPSPAPHADSQDSLASPFPDFSAHLDLWTNLAFESDEPVAHVKGKRKLTEEEDENPSPLGLPTHEGHENIIHPPNAATNSTGAPHDVNAPPFDINALLAGFGIDPFLMPTAAPTPVQPQNNPPAQVPAVPSLAQLLALHASQGGTYAVPPPAPAVTAQPPASASASHSSSKRARTQKNSGYSDTSDILSPTSSADHEDFAQGESGTPLNAAEDKRRRNTAASARFRLKKKEREAALERRAKELEERVAELERECEGLRRENGWLKGLVVGVTGAGAAQQQVAGK
ncbi:hypothetical protein HYDPIDRAFT_105986 [Hydnomerulius pinastri MD-312]|nr:hypothetical protein HYDPIDRAFT_105986 [Hydnomerulius pinastri MD-312]